MAKHKKKDAAAARRQSSAIRGMLAKLGRLRADLQQMIDAPTKTVRDPLLVEVPVTEEDRADWRGKLAEIVEKERLLTEELARLAPVPRPADIPGD